MGSATEDIPHLPSYDDLPPVKDMPKGCAWGVFDKDGKKDAYGTLNLLTPEVIKAAAAEVRDGVSISLNWPLDSLSKFNIPGRKPASHKLQTLQEARLSAGVGWDDEIDFNTQGSSQWDSLVHWAHQPTGLSYNGFVSCPPGSDTAHLADAPTIDRWHARGGVVGRGVLIDWKSYAEDKGIPYHPLLGAATRVSVEDIEAVAAHQGVEFRAGDILLIRFGTTEAYDELDPAALMANMAENGPQLSGLHGSEETARWLWDRRFAAVAADNNSFEAFPPVNEDGSVAGFADLVLHPYLLSLFGMPIGELWDLKALAGHCKRTGRWSFMLTSAPLNISCLVGSPPNALAIF